MNQQIIAAVIFLITYAIIVSERLHRTTAALVGAMLMILLGVLPQEEAFHEGPVKNLAYQSLQKSLK